MALARKAFANRKCVEFAQCYSLGLDPQEERTRTLEETETLIRFIDDNIVGKEQTFAGPFGRRKVVYCDYTASARSLLFIEEYILSEVLPLYGNTHATTTITSMQSTLYREESRSIMRSAVNASDDDVVLFAGSGCTGAISKLVRALNLSAPPIVFVGPCEHYSHLLPWRELGAKIVRVSETKEGMLDLTDLQKKLDFYQSNFPGERMIGCFSAASNITGIFADDVATTIMLHQYGALAFWDYATAAPYVTMDMNPLVPGIGKHAPHKDAIFFSGHKFVGGVQSPGVLVVKKSLFSNHPVPDIGECYDFNCHDQYPKNTELEEEGGTAPIVESIRAGMVMKLKQAVGVPTIMEYVDNIVKTVLSFIRKIPEITLLGSSSQNVKRLAVFSIMVRHPRGSYLHHNFICAILNDMFGIQARGGCACAGPYAQDLMGISEELASHYEEVLTDDSHVDDHIHHRSERHSCNEMLRPGFTRLSFPFFMSETEVGYVLEALKMVATEGWKLLPQYVLNPETGEWKHNSNMYYRERKWLGNIKYTNGTMIVHERKTSSVSPCPNDFNEVLKTARSIFNKARKLAKRHPLEEECSFNDSLDPLRWFMLPNEAQHLLLGQSRNVKQDVPFSPSVYLGSRPNSSSSFDLRRHHSLTVPDSEFLTNRDVKILRQRSESNSPARNAKSKLQQNIPSRERCYSLGSSLISELPSKSPQLSRERLLSCSSQADNTDSESSSPGGENDKLDGLMDLRFTPDLVYVEGITKELATEIKSELREVIAQVDDVLAESNDSDGHYDYQRSNKRKNFSLPMSVPHTADNSNFQQGLLGHRGCKPTVESCPLPTTISAERFSEYLVGFASEVVSEMKSEFRDVVNAVDGIMSPMNDSNKVSTPVTEVPKFNKNNNFIVTGVDSPNALVKNVKFDTDLQCSQDSGINLTERDLSPTEALEKRLKLYDSTSMNKTPLQSSDDHNENENNDSGAHWYYPSKDIWKPTVEAINEFEMISDGDKVLVCLSGGRDSLSLLHVLRQYQYYASSKGIVFTFGAATIQTDGRENSDSLKTYLKSLGVDYFVDHIDEDKDVCNYSDRIKISKIYDVAKEHEFNVVAMAPNLDDFSERFLTSVFHQGYIRTMKANATIKDKGLRVIRPFVYVRARAVKQFTEEKYWPVTFDDRKAHFEIPKERQRVKLFLAQQEIHCPGLFSSIKSAMKPLIGGVCQENDAYKVA